MVRGKYGSYKENEIWNWSFSYNFVCLSRCLKMSRNEKKGFLRVDEPSEVLFRSKIWTCS